MTLQQLKYFITIAESGSFGKASQKLYISQPSISNVVHELENELSMQIFIRTPKGVILTPRGKELYKYALGLVEKSNELIDYFKNNKTHDTEHFSVSSQHYSFVVKAYAGLINSYNNSKYIFRSKESNMADVIDDVSKTISEIGIIGRPDNSQKHIDKILEQKNLDFTSLCYIKPHVFLHKSHPLSKKEKLTAEDLKPYPSINYSLDDNMPLFFAEEISSGSFIPDKVIYTNDLYTSICFIRSCQAYDVGTGILTSLLSEEFVAVPFDMDNAINIGYLTHKNIPLSEPAIKLIELLKKELP